MSDIIRCISCQGYGWVTDDLDGQSADCDWCGGIGYTYHEGGCDRRIPPTDFEQVSATLEALEAERLRELGYTGSAKRPWEQAIRNGKFPKPDANP